MSKPIGAKYYLKLVPSEIGADYDTQEFDSFAAVQLHLSLRGLSAVWHEAYKEWLILNEWGYTTGWLTKAYQQ